MSGGRAGPHGRVHTITVGYDDRVVVSSLAAGLAMMGVGLPPPLCRGRVAARYDPRLDRSPSPRAIAEVQAAYDALCPADCGRGTLYENPTIGMNAATWVSGVGQGAGTQVKIVYSRRFLNGLNDQFGPGASFGVLAHEVGHHLTAALSMRQRGESNWNEELRADYLAGCALGRSGRSSEELENALRALAQSATRSHPSFAKRNPVLRRGYRDCRNQAGGAPRQRPAFGIQGLLSEPNQAGCYRYRYRLAEDVGRVGPVAAPLRRSRRFEEEAECEAERTRLTKARLRVTEPCVCRATLPAP